jgi:hypothetical protein
MWFLFCDDDSLFVSRLYHNYFHATVRIHCFQTYPEAFGIRSLFLKDQWPATFIEDNAQKTAQACG